VSPTARPVEFNLTSTNFEVVHYVGGRWHTCAAHGEICACTGVARYGQDAMSIPVAVKGQVLCLPGPFFPNLGFGTSCSCNCSVDANILVKVKIMTARVRAANYPGTGVFSLPALVMILGVSGQVGPILVEEKKFVVKVRWNEPQDTRFGVGGQVSETKSYRVLLECSSEGTNTLGHIPPSQCEGEQSLHRHNKWYTIASC